MDEGSKGQGLLASAASRFIRFLRGPSVGPVLGETTSSVSSLVRYGAGLASRLMRSVVITVAGPSYFPRRKRRAATRTTVSPDAEEETDDEVPRESPEESQDDPEAFERASFPSFSRSSQTALTRMALSNRAPPGTSFTPSRLQNSTEATVSAPADSDTTFQDDVVRASVSPIAAALSFQTAATGVASVAASTFEMSLLQPEGQVPGTAFSSAEGRASPQSTIGTQEPMAHTQDSTSLPAGDAAPVVASALGQQPYVYGTSGVTSTISSAPRLISSLLMQASEAIEGSSPSYTGVSVLSGGAVEAAGLTVEAQRTSAPVRSSAGGSPSGLTTQAGKRVQPPATPSSSAARFPVPALTPGQSPPTAPSPALSPAASPRPASPAMSTQSHVSAAEGGVSLRSRASTGVSIPSPLSASLAAAAAVSATVARLGLVASPDSAGGASPAGERASSIVSSERQAAVLPAVSPRAGSGLQKLTGPNPPAGSAGSAHASQSSASPSPGHPGQSQPALGTRWTDVIAKIAESQGLLASAVSAPASARSLRATAELPSAEPESEASAFNPPSREARGEGHAAPAGSVENHTSSVAGREGSHTPKAAAAAAGSDASSVPLPPFPGVPVASIPEMPPSSNSGPSASQVETAPSSVSYGPTLQTDSAQIARQDGAFGLLPRLQSLVGSMQSNISAVEVRPASSIWPSPSASLPPGVSPLTPASRSGPSSSFAALTRSEAGNDLYPRSAVAAADEGPEAGETEAAAPDASKAEVPYSQRPRGAATYQPALHVPSRVASSVSTASSPISPAAPASSAPSPGGHTRPLRLGSLTSDTGGAVTSAPAVQSGAVRAGSPDEGDEPHADGRWLQSGTAETPSSATMLSRHPTPSILQMPSITKTVSLASSVSAMGSSFFQSTRTVHSTVRPSAGIQPHPEVPAPKAAQKRREGETPKSELPAALEVASAGMANEEDVEEEDTASLLKKIEAVLEEELRRYGIQ
jgi:hypothetical protein